MSSNERRLYALTVLDSNIGAATTPVGVLGVDGTELLVSWLPGADTSEWMSRLSALDVHSDKCEALAELFDRSNSISWDIAEITSGFQGDLRGAVEDALDNLMATPG